MKKIPLILSFCVTAFAPAFAQYPIIRTIVGTGTAGYSGDGAAATAATINWSNDVLYDKATGDVYVADGNNHRIRKVSPTGVITTIAGTGTAGALGDGGLATAATMNKPMFMCMDTARNLWFIDYNNASVRKITHATGLITKVAGTGTAGFSGDGGAATSAQLNAPQGIGCDRRGNIFISDLANHRIRKVNAAGVISTIAGTGIAGYSGDGGLATAAMVRNPNYIVIDTIGNLYFSDNGNQRIRKIDTFGVITTVAGIGIAGFSGDSGPATAARLNSPCGLTLDNSGNLYIADNANYKIRKVNSSGVITTYAGNGISGTTGDGGAATAATLGPVGGINIDAQGRLYISDGSNNKVRLVTSICYGMPTTGGAVVTPSSGTSTTTFTARLSGAVYEPGLNYQWQQSTSATGAYTNISGATDTSYTASGYTVTTYLRCLISCVASVDSSLIDTVHVAPTMVESVAGSAGIAIQPNPANSIVYVSAQMPVIVDVFDLVGKHLLHVPGAVVDISSLATGIYILRISDSDGNLLKKEKLLKQ